MGRTLFWYVFKDLVRIFMMASGALAGIMSFGGLLRPLTQQGLDAGQVSKILSYFTFPMMAYSLPVAALFAATMVYGRLSADNELTACRAGGISHLGAAMPAFVLGLLVAILSLLMLCFVVPIYTLKVEKVIYSNLAKLIANRIERTHEIRFGDFNVFAQNAFLPGPDPKNPNRQRVVLESVSIVTYERPERRAASRGDNPDAPDSGGGKGTDAGAGPAVAADASDARVKKPREFLMASTATLVIHERPDDQVDMLIGLEGGTKFPREFKGGQQVGIGTTQFGPIEMPSPIKEDPKFMKLQELRELYNNPEQSRRLQGLMTDFVRREQASKYMDTLYSKLVQSGRLTFEGEQSRIVLTLARPVPPERHGYGEEMAVYGEEPGLVTFERTGEDPTVQVAKQLVIRARPDPTQAQMHVTIELIGRSPRGGDADRLRPSAGPVAGNYSATITVPMDREMVKLRGRRFADYPRPGQATRGDLLRLRVGEADLNRLNREAIVLSNAILAESNGRASFAVSCFILVLVGCALGMMFRSGNFLTAFAVSFIPALLCITLIVSGQQTCHAIPWMHPERNNPLRLGLMLIWSGNAINLVLAVGLLWRLQRE